MQLGFAEVRSTELCGDGNVVLSAIAAADGPSLDAAFLAPSMRSVELNVTAGRPMQIAIRYERAKMSQFPNNSPSTSNCTRTATTNNYWTTPSGLPVPRTW